MKCHAETGDMLMKNVAFWLTLTALVAGFALAFAVACGDDDDDDDDDSASDDDTIDPGAIDCTDFCGFCAGCQGAAGFNVPECNVDDSFDATECLDACEVGDLDAVVYTLPDGEFQDWTCEELDDFFANAD